MKTILVPTDFSKNAEHALNYALAIAKREKAKILLLHAYNITFISPDMPMNFYSEQLDATKAEVDALLSGISKRVVSKSKVQCECMSVHGAIAEIIPHLVPKRRINLVIMGTKGASGMKELLVGSNTASVIMKTTCPVIAVPEKAAITDIRQITYATDFFESDLRALKKLAEFAKLCKARIQIVHVEEPDYADESGTMAKFKKKVLDKIGHKSISFRMLPGKDTEKSLMKYLKENHSDLFAITSGDKTWLERFLFKSLSKKLIYHTRIPLMVFHTKIK